MSISYIDVDTHSYLLLVSYGIIINSLYLLSLLKSSGAFEVAGGAKPNDLAAIQVNPNSTDWILATVISQDPDTGMYQLADEDAESNKVFNLPDIEYTSHSA